MADKKITQLTAVTPPINKSSYVVSSTYDGVSAYTSEKVTLSQLADAVYLMDAEQKITFDDSGTNKVFVTNGTAGFQFDGDIIDISSDNGTLAESFLELTATEGLIAFANSGAAGGGEVQVNGTNSIIRRNGTDYITVTDSGIGFYGAAAVAQQTGVAVSAAAIHTALVNLGLITA